MASGDDCKKCEIRCGGSVGANMGAPFNMVCPQVAREVGSRLGMVEEVKQRRRNDMQNLFMRVKVAIPISKPIR